MKMKQYFIHATLVLLLSNSLVGCALFTKTVEIETCHEKPALIIHDPEPVEFSDLHFSISEDGTSVVLPITEFKNFSNSMNGLKNYILLLKKNIQSYQEYYEPNNNSKEIPK